MKIRILLILLTISLSPQLGHAQWVQTNGPYDGNVIALAVSGTTIFAGTRSVQYGSCIGGSIFRSTDNGVSWSAANNGLTSTTIFALAANSTYIFAGTYCGGVFRSSNNGDTWAQSSIGLPYNYIPTLAAMGPIVVAAIEGGGVYRSTNSGFRWVQSNTGMSGHNSVHAFGVIGSNLYAVASDGVFLSTDSGASWMVASGGFPLPSHIYASSGTNFFAITSDSVYQSTNSGITWVTKKSGLTNGPANALAVIGTKLFAGTDGVGVSVSTDGGSSWAASNTGLRNTEVQCLPVIGSNLFAETTDGAFVSANDGASWDKATAGVPSVEITSFEENGTNLLAGSGAHLYHSTDSGANWSVNNSVLFSSIFTLTANDVYVFAGTNGGLYISSDNGVTWGVPLEIGLPVYTYHFISLAKMNTNVFIGTDGGGVYMSTDNGTNWTEMSSGTFNLSSFNALAVSGTNLLAGTDGGVFLSTDSGISWSPLNTGLTDSNILSLAVKDSTLFAGTYAAGVWHRPLSEILPSPYAISTGQDSLAFGSVFVGNDSTVLFALRNTGSAEVRITSIEFLPSDSNFTRSAVTLPMTLLPDNALSFNVIFRPHSTGPLAGSLVISSEAKELRVPLSGTGIDSTHKLSAQYASLSFGNVDIGKDSTLPLSLKNTGNTTINLTTIEYLPVGTAFTYSAVNLPAMLKPGDSVIFSVTFTPLAEGDQADTLVAVSEANLLEVPLSGTGVSGAGVRDVVGFVTSLQCYPNPSSQSSTITFSSAESGVGEVTIVNLLGEEVARLFSGELSAGEHSFTWDPKDVVPGTYECIVRVNGNTQHIPLSLVR